MKTFIFIYILFATVTTHAQSINGPCSFVINLYPANATKNQGELVNWVCGVSPTTNISYQWQMDNGSGFVNMVDTGSISGSNTFTLTMNVTFAMDNYWFHCVVNDGSCSDTTKKHRLNVIDVGLLSHTNDKAELSIYPNPATNKFTLTGLKKSSSFRIADLNGKIILNGDIKNEGTISTSNIKAGVYLLMISGYIPRRLVLMTAD